MSTRLALAALFTIALFAFGVWAIFAAVGYADTGRQACHQRYGPQADYWGPGKCRITQEVPL